MTERKSDDVLERLANYLEWRDRIVTHDVVGAVGRALGSLNVAALSDDPDDVRRATAGARDQLSFAIGLYDEVGRLDPWRLKQQEFDVGDVLGRIVAERRYYYADDDVAPIHWARPDDAPLFADSIEPLVGVIARNLIDNALKYSPPAGLVTVEANVGPDLRPYFVVRDQGPGLSAFPEGYDPHKPMRGQRGDAARAAKPGMGLGLYLVRGAADVLGAELAYKDRAGSEKGLEVQVTLPHAASRPGGLSALRSRGLNGLRGILGAAVPAQIARDVVERAVASVEDVCAARNLNIIAHGAIYLVGEEAEKIERILEFILGELATDMAVRSSIDIGGEERAAEAAGAIRPAVTLRVPRADLPSGWADENAAWRLTADNWISAMDGARLSVRQQENDDDISLTIELHSRRRGASPFVG